MIAVGIDISKAKSTVAVIDSDGTVLASPFTMAHTQPEMEAFVTYLKGLGEPTTILMEYTGHYHYPVLKKRRVSRLHCQSIPDEKIRGCRDS